MEICHLHIFIIVKIMLKIQIYPLFLCLNVMVFFCLLCAYAIIIRPINIATTTTNTYLFFILTPIV
ncbi:hypothetical protein S122051_2749 [Staphylococcus aureus subsp. aureus 122051]|nr:hypothetical protein S122051_2749 [Staphylococcus aureus subsp. aureus 122051]